MSASSQQTRVQPFSEFFEELTKAQHEQYKARPAARVRSPQAFDEQKEHLRKLYEGVKPAGSFTDASGQIFDCVPIEQQPALRGGRAVATPPAPPSLGTPPAAAIPSPASGRCPQGTIPMRRITLDELSRFETLEHYLRKHGPPRKRQRGADAPRGSAPEPNATPHEYAHGSQSVANVGGHSILNVWDPAVASGQRFSLSQHWYVADGANGVQTVEVGWQVYPAMYGHAQPVLFTYWTADGYATTGSYSNTGGEFVQTGTFPVGSAISPWSQSGGNQVELAITVLLSGGNWWIFVNGADPAHAIGYYPALLYQGGPLASGATMIDYGGETIGSTSYPPMGSGAFAEQGYKIAAYQRNIYSFSAAGASADADLVPSEDWPTSYTIQVNHSTDWGEYFFFGGPGGGTSQTAPLVSSVSSPGLAPTLTLHGAAGTRVEGLSLEDAASLLRRVSRG